PSTADLPMMELIGPPAQLTHTAHRREKRCSCENQKDKECIFFLPHWHRLGQHPKVGPSHLVPYGFGSLRLRRELGRCICRDRRDAECLSFCAAQTQSG
uniref:Endothelin-like toxin domain-containing protein n=1 Tax=Echeneis naucrates TaxID=173247 RepID=A0A665VT33_ECHNA